MKIEGRKYKMNVHHYRKCSKYNAAILAKEKP
ncbi:unnamed protein product [Spodoptera exigua]|nr:unnamed protein product [Spodoptera exigua]